MSHGRTVEEVGKDCCRLHLSTLGVRNPTTCGCGRRWIVRERTWWCITPVLNAALNVCGDCLQPTDLDETACPMQCARHKSAPIYSVEVEVEPADVIRAVEAAYGVPIPGQAVSVTLR